MGSAALHIRSDPHTHQQLLQSKPGGPCADRRRVMQRKRCSDDGSRARCAWKVSSGCSDAGSANMVKGVGWRWIVLERAQHHPPMRHNLMHCTLDSTRFQDILP